jgi:hypothetical protein
MIISEFKNKDGINYRPKRILIKCDNCEIEYNRTIISQRKRFNLYNKDLCGSCGQKKQYLEGIRSKDQCYKGGKSAKEKMKGKTFKELFSEKQYEEIIQSISIHSKGDKNNMYGRNDQCYGIIKRSKLLKGKKFTEIYSLNQCKIIKNKISKASSGKNNGMYGKPSPIGSGNGWSGWYKEWYFRSLHELSYMINVIERFNLKWESAERKNLRILYTDFNGINRTYVADFIINNKYLVEIKPKKLHKSKNVQLKKKAAIDFCKNKNLIYKILDAPFLTKEKISYLYKTNQIKFIERYKQRIHDYLNT